MTALDLPALDGRSPLGFLAALGVHRLVSDHTGHPARLAWSPQTGTAVLHDAQPDADTLVADLTTIMKDTADGGVLPRMSSDFPPLGAAPDKLRLPRSEFATYAERISESDGTAGEQWLSSLVTDLSVDDQRRADISQFAAPSGRQSMRTMLEKPLELVRANPGLLREALLGWRRYPEVSGEYLDHRVLFDAADSGNGKPTERGVPGATWLALMSYPLFRTTAIRGEPATTCWQDFGKEGGKRMVYPLWTAPLDIDAVRAVLVHPVLIGAHEGAAPTQAGPLSIFWVVHAARRRIPARTFAGVLAPAPPLRPRPVRRTR